MQQEQTTALKALLNKRMQSVGAETLRREGETETAQLEGLNRLARLVEIHEAARPAPVRRRWPVVAVLLITLTLLSVLLFVRVPQTEVELDVRLSQVSFVLEKPALISEPLALKSLGVVGLQELGLPRSRQAPARRLSAANGQPLALELAPAADEGQTGLLTLGGLLLPSGTHVLLSTAEADGGFRLELKADDLPVYVTAKGRLHVTGLPEGDRVLDIPSPRSVELRAGSDWLELVILPREGTKIRFATQLTAGSLTMARVEDFMDADQTVVRQLSTLLSGNLYFEALNGQKYELRPREALRFERSLGAIRSISLEQDAISLHYRGIVKGMETGGTESGRSLMPTLLDWIKAQHGLSLLWGSTLYLFGLVLSVLRWWGKLR